MAFIDPNNENIRITSFENPYYQAPIITKNELINYDNLENELNIIEKTDIEADFDIGDSRLAFYLPIEGTGEEYLIAEISIKENLAYYCVSNSLPNLKKIVERKGTKHFPGILDLKNIEIKYVSDKLVFSPVPGFTARNAFNKIENKKINTVEIPAYISIPNDAELTPIVDMGKGHIKDLKIKKRTILAKYEINAIAEKFGTIINAKITEINNEIVWELLINNEKLYFNPINGEEINFKDKVR